MTLSGIEYENYFLKINLTSNNNNIITLDGSEE
jgi:hypothetical protein